MNSLHVSLALACLSTSVALAQMPDAFNPGADDAVFAIVPQTDGRLLVGGRFTTINGQSSSGIIRLLADGTPDTTFNPIAATPSYPAGFSFGIQPDGKMLVGGGYSTISGQAFSCLSRFKPDGTLDANFVPPPAKTKVIAGPFISSIALQTNGQIVIGGWFDTLGGSNVALLGRLNSDGTLDSTFRPGQTNDYGIDRPNYEALAVVLQPDGKILVGGFFTELAGQACFSLGRLHPDGSRDTNFNAYVQGGHYPEVYSLALQPDGKILVGGAFQSVNSQTRNYICRLNSNGSLDSAFDPEANGAVRSIALQADGRILVVGSFSSLAGQPCNRVGRLNADGTLDHDFNPGASDQIYMVTLQGDGSFLLGGEFSSITGQPRARVARMLNFTTATQSLAFDGSTITWLRGGTSAEVWRTIFEASTDGTNWTTLGAGARITGGWQLTTATLPAGATVRARGFAAGSQYGGSCWFLESTLQLPVPPRIVVGDGAFGFGSNHFGFNLTGPTGRTVIIQASSNLFDWFALATNSLDNPPLYFSDPSSQFHAQRFYRLRLL